MALLNKTLSLLAATTALSQGALSWSGATAVSADPAVNGLAIPSSTPLLDNVTGYTGASADSVLGPRNLNSADVGFTHDLAFLSSTGAALAMNDVRLSTMNGRLGFVLATPLAAGETFSVNVTFSLGLGTWETGGGSNPYQTATATDPVTNALLRGSLRILTAARVAGSDYTDIVVTSTLSETPGDGGLTGGDYDLLSVAPPNNATSLTPSSSDAANPTLGNVITYGFVGADNAGNFISAFGDSAPGGNPTPFTNFTDTVVWEIQAGAAGLEVGSSFLITFDGSPFPVPEPSAMLLSLIGIAIPVLRRRR